MSEWKEIELGNHSDILSSKRIFAADYVPEGIIFYRSKEAIERALGQQISNPLYITKEKYESIKEKYGAPKDRDILLSAVGERAGIPYLVNGDGEFYFKDGNLIWFRNFSNDLDSCFLTYYIKSRIGQFQLSNMMIGSAQKALTIIGLRDMVISVPNINEQKQIAKTLSNLDQKITLLRQQNQTLEQLAQTLFKRWFVEFEFPCLPQNYRFSGHVNSNHNLESVLTYKKVGGLPVPEDKSWFVYVLLCEDNSFYKGMTTDLYRRFYEHYIGEGAKHTKTHKPIKVIHWEQFNSQKEARKREEELKTGYGRTWIKREYDKFLKYGHPQKGGLPAHQTRLIMAGKMVSSELGEIPEGWEVKPLSSIANYLNGLACQKFPVVDQKEKLPVLKIKELGNGIKDNVDWATSNVDSKYIINSGDIIFSWSGTLMLKIWDGETCVLNQHLFKVTSDLLPDWFIFQWTNYYLTHFIAVAKSKATTMGHIKRSHLDEALCFVPDKELLNEFDGAFKLSLESFKNNSKEIQTLTKLRDTLLPKLMSGELKVNPKNN